MRKIDRSGQDCIRKDIEKRRRNAARILAVAECLREFHEAEIAGPVSGRQLKIKK